MYSFNGVIVVPRKHSKYKIAILAQILCGFFLRKGPSIYYVSKGLGG